MQQIYKDDWEIAKAIYTNVNAAFYHYQTVNHRFKHFDIGDVLFDYYSTLRWLLYFCGYHIYLYISFKKRFFTAESYLIPPSCFLFCFPVWGATLVLLILILFLIICALFNFITIFLIEILFLQGLFLFTRFVFP